MTDPAVVAALGIETVEWLDEAGDRVTVRISGRWRRRPTSTGQPWLVVEAHGERNRFPAMPEPPGLGGTLPGTWRMSFRVPTDIARAPNMRTWLQLGGVLVPLPAEPAVQPIAPTLEPRSVGVSELEEAVREEQLREAEQALEAERVRTAAAEAAAADLAARVAALTQELEQRQGDIRRLDAAVAEREQTLRGERQHAHAEEMVRLELVRERDRLRDTLEASRLRACGLEEDLAAARRRADEAEHLAAAARRSAPPASPRLPRRARVYSAERTLAHLVRDVDAPAPLRQLPARPGWSDREREIVAARAALIVRTETEPAPPPDDGKEAELMATLDILRDEVSEWRTTAERERDARAAAEAVGELLRRELEQQRARSARAFSALDELRDQIEWVRRTYVSLAAQVEAAPAPGPESAATATAPPATAPPATAPPAAAPPAAAPPAGAPDPSTIPTEARNGGFELHRLDAARTRLREQMPAELAEEATPEPPAAAPPSRPEVENEATFTLALLAKHDLERAGALLIALLPAQGLVHPAPIAYDLVLRRGSTVRVTVARWGVTEIDRTEAPRPLAEVRFQLEGDPVQIVRLLSARTARRFFRRRRLARVRGDREAVAALRTLFLAELPAGELRRAGVRLDQVDSGADQPNRATSG